MLVQTLVFFASRHILHPPFLQNVNVFGAHTIGADTTQQLIAPFVANNNSFGNPTVALGTPQDLAPTFFQNTNTFETPTIGDEPASPFIDGALELNDDGDVLLITPDDDLQIQQ